MKDKNRKIRSKQYIEFDIDKESSSEKVELGQDIEDFDKSREQEELEGAAEDKTEESVDSDSSESVDNQAESEGEEYSNDETSMDNDSDEDEDWNNEGDHDEEDRHTKDSNSNEGEPEDVSADHVDPKRRQSINPNRVTKGLDGGKLEDKSIPDIPGGQEDGEGVINKINATKKIGETAIKGVKRASQGFAMLGKILLNPIFWVSIIVIMLLAIFSSSLTILGQNDFNELCDPTGTGGVSLGVEGSEDDFTRQSAIVAWLTSNPFSALGNQPMTKEQASGVMGNLIQESWGANPKAIQGDNSQSKWQSCNNECVLGWGSGGGKAIGIVQWDRGRRINLVEFAKAAGTQWHDLETQLKYLQHELDDPYESKRLERYGFTNTSKSIADYARIWNKSFERSGDNAAQIEQRVVSAEGFASNYTGGGAIGGGMADNCISGGMAGGDMSNLVQLAIESAHANRADGLVRPKCSSYVNCGTSKSKPAYIAAKAAAQAETGADPLPTLYASCDRFVATMLRASKTDVDFPWGGTSAQASYMKGSPKWKSISCQDRQPGDVLWTPGHIMLYVGEVNGVDSIASASLKERTGTISSTSCNGTRFNADSGSPEGFRRVN